MLLLKPSIFRAGYLLLMFRRPLFPQSQMNKSKLGVKKQGLESHRGLSCLSVITVY